MSPTANRVLSMAAIAGPTFSYLLLERVCEPGPDELLDALDEAAGARVIVAIRAGPGVTCSLMPSSAKSCCRS